MNYLDQRLREQQFYARSLVEANPDAVMITDSLGIISDVNERMIALTGRTRHELIGALCRSLFLDFEPAKTAMERVLTQGRVRNSELANTDLTVRSVDGQEVPVACNAAALYNRDRTVAGVFVSLRTATKPQPAGASMPNATGETNNANQVKSEFLANFSHDLRTPLNAIIGFSEALKDGLVGEMTEEQRNYIGDIYASGNRLLALITDVLDVSKGGQPETEPRAEPSSLPRTELRAEPTAGPRIEPASKPHTQPPGDPLHQSDSGPQPAPAEHLAMVVEDDPDSAELMRLLLAAEGFAVVLAGSGEEGLVLAQQHPLSLITLDVSLPGMDGWGFLRRLREHKALVSVPVVIIAGVANMSMALTHGAAAVLEKPITRARLRHSLAVLGLHPRSNRTQKILVVDDDRETVDVITRFLTKPDYAVESAFTKTDAIAMAQSLKPDLILLNLSMENFSGYQVVTQLQHHETTEHIPVLVVTAKQLTKREREAVVSDPAQPVQVLSKSKFDHTAFIAEVQRALLH